MPLAIKTGAHLWRKDRVAKSEREFYILCDNLCTMLSNLYTQYSHSVISLFHQDGPVVL